MSERTSPDKRRLLERLLRRRAAADHQPADHQQALSDSQHRLWVAHHLDPADPTLNMRTALRAEGRLDRRALAAAVSDLPGRHELLRAHIRERKQQPRILIRPQLELGIEDLELPADAEDRLDAARRQAAEISSRPFDLTRGPLLRVALIRLAERDAMLVLVVHHIICDGWSMELLIRDLIERYQQHATGETGALARPLGRYRQFVQAQHDLLTGPDRQRLERFWRQALDGLSRVRRLPADHPRPATPQLRARRRAFVFPPAPRDDVGQLARSHRTTPFAVILAALAALLHRITDEADVVIATPVANRQREEWEGVLGYFVNLLPMRVTVDPEERFEDLLARTHRGVLAAHAHQQLPIQEIAEVAGIRATDLLRISLQHSAEPVLSPRGSDLTFRPEPIDVGSSRFELALATHAATEGLAGTLEYSTDLFEAATAECLLADLEGVFLQVIESPRRRIADLAVDDRWVGLRTVADRNADREASTASAEPPAPGAGADDGDGGPQASLARIWREVLSLPTISPFDNFLDIGGDSLLAVQVIERVEGELGARLTPGELFTQTLAQLAASVERRGA